MNAAPEFTPYAAAHCVALAFIALAAVVMIGVTRWDGPDRPGSRRCLLNGLAILLAANVLFEQIYSLAVGLWSVRHTLPLHLCDLSGLACIATLIALGSRRESLGKSDAGFVHQRPWLMQLSELVYYWGLGGALQALLTPDASQGFPSPLFFTYFIAHGSILSTVGILTLGSGWRPRPGSFVRVWLWTLLLAAVVFTVDWLLGANYMFLMGPTGKPTVLDLLGEWPWPYLLNLSLLGLACMALCYVPVAMIRPGVSAGLWCRRRGSG